MRKKKKSRNKRLQRIFLLLIVVITIIIVALGVQINRLQKISSNEGAVSNVTEVKQKDADKIDSNTKVDTLKYDTFINKKYTQSQLENLSDREIAQLYNDYDKPKEIEYRKALGSASTEDSAKNVASRVYKKDNNIVRSSEVTGQNDLYYVVNVNYDYINGNVSKRYSVNVIVFKTFYYNDEKNTFNVDDVENAKIIMDLDNYINDFSNGAKMNIQAFIQKNGQNYEYVLYYLSLNYGQSDKNDTADLMRKVVSIDAATGEVVGTDRFAVRTGIEI